jgi:hypothetical protein
MLAELPLYLSIKTDVQGKLDKSNIGQKMALDWQNVQFNFNDFIDHLKKGHPYGYQWEFGIRKSDYFKKANLVSVDFDKGAISVDQFLSDPFVKENVAIIYKTHSYTENCHRFRAIFVLPVNIHDVHLIKAINKGLYKKLANIFKFKDPNDFIDTSTHDAGRFFFGSTESIVYEKEICINHSLYDELRILGSIELGVIVEPIKTIKSEITLSKLTPIRIAHGDFVALQTLHSKQSVHCPFHSPDKHPSALVVHSESGVIGIHCRVCKTTKFSEPYQKATYNFYKFDDLVKNNKNTYNKFHAFKGLELLFEGPLPKNHEAYHFKEYDEQYINIDFKPKGIHLIKSAKGTGKTVLIEKIVNQAKFNGQIFNFEKNNKIYKEIPVLLVGHRQALLAETCKRLEITCYLDSKFSDRDFNSRSNKNDLIKTHKPKFYGISIDSLISRMQGSSEHFPIIIIDESEQVFSHFLADSLKKRVDNFFVLAGLIQNASHVYCFDADMGEITIQGITSCFDVDKNHDKKIRDILFNNHLRDLNLGKPNINNDQTSDINYFPEENISTPTFFKSDIYFHLNTYIPEAGNLVLFDSSNEIQGHLIESIKSNKKCFVVSNSKKIIDNLTAMIKRLFPALKVFSITSENSNQTEVRIKVTNMVSTVKTHDVILASPSLGTGIDISFENKERIVDCVYGIFNSKINTHFDIDQQLGRVRHPKNVYVWVCKKNSTLCTDERLIKASLKDNPNIYTDFYEINSDGIAYKTTSDPFMNLAYVIEKIRNISINQLKDNFIKLKKNNNWVIKHFKKDDYVRELGQIINVKGKLLNTVQKYDALMNAKDISYEDYELIRQKREKNKSILHSEYFEALKYSFKHFYKVEKIDEGLFYFDNNGKSREAIQLYEIMTKTDLDLLRSRNDIQHYLRYDFSIDHKEKNNGPFNIERQTKLHEKAQVLKEFFEAAGIFQDRNFVLEQKWNNTSLIKFKSLCNVPKKYANFERLFGIPRRRDIDYKTCTQFHSFLQVLRLDRILIERNRGNKNTAYTYKLDPQSIKVIQDIVKTRSS